MGIATKGSGNVGEKIANALEALWQLLQDQNAPCERASLPVFARAIDDGKGSQLCWDSSASERSRWASDAALYEQFSLVGAIGLPTDPGGNCWNARVGKRGDRDNR